MSDSSSLNELGFITNEGNISLSLKNLLDVKKTLVCFFFFYF